MQPIEYFYEKSQTKHLYLPRKVRLPKQDKILLTGTKYCGKRSLIYNYLQENFAPSKRLFIDFDDFRCDKEYIQKHIQSFIDEKKIECLVYYGYDTSIAIPECDNIILASHQNIDVDGFTKIVLKNLDFEEFMLFEKKQDIKVLFNHFLKSGNFPHITKYEEKDKRVQEIYALTFKENIHLLQEISFYQGHIVSAYFLYNRIKAKYKISKDRFYTFFEELIDNRYLFALERYGAKRSPKKLFFYDFLIKSIFYTQKEFPKSFENMVYLEIEAPEVFYTDPLGLYIPAKKRLVVPIPFGNEVRIQHKIEQILQKNTVALEKIEVVTVASSFHYEQKNILCEIVPFYEWAVAKEYN